LIKKVYQFVDKNYFRILKENTNLIFKLAFLHAIMLERDK